MSSLVYFILGTPGAGRRVLVADLIGNGFAPPQPVLVLLAEGDPADPADAKLAALANAEVRRWRWTPPDLPPVKGVAGATVFFFADPQAGPVDQLEALKPWLERHSLRLARILGVIDCQLAHRHPELLQWFDACVHFSDVVFLTRRAGLPNKWLSDFFRHFTDQHLPCHFLQPKNGEVDNPALVLDPEPRRVSEYFDEAVAITPDDIEGDDEVELTPEDLAPPVDPYFARRRGGRRVREIPSLGDIASDGGAE
jgi:hypothetical protein